MWVGLRGLEDVHAHHVARGIVQDQVEVIELDDAMQAFGEIVEQVAQIAVQRNCLGTSSRIWYGLDAGWNGFAPKTKTPWQFRIALARSGTQPQVTRREMFSELCEIFLTW